MALTVEQIHTVADQIAETGEKPTLARVRKALGGGSFSTISEAMQSWRERQAAEHALAEVVVPEALSERVEQLKAEAWKSAISEAERRLSAEREALAEAQQAADAAMAESQEAVDTLEAEAEARDAEVVALKEQLAAAQAETQAAISAQQKAEQRREADAARLGERIEGLEARLDDTANACKSAEAREAATAQDAKAASERLEQVREKLAKVEQSAATAQAQAHERADALAAEKQARQAAETALSDERQRHESELEEWRKELDAAQLVAGESTQLRERVAGMESRLSDAHRTIERLTAVAESEQARKDRGPGSADDQPKLPL